MSSQVSTDGKTSWSHYRGSKLGFGLILTIGSVICIGALYRFAESPSETGFLLISAGGILWILAAFYFWGNNDIVFDDQSQSIYIKKKRFCSTCSTTEKVGQYSAGFKACEVKERIGHSEGVGRTRYYSLNFIFENGVTHEGKGDPYNKEEMVQIAQEINEWWKTHPFNASQQIQTAPVQVMVQQPPIQGTAMPGQQHPIQMMVQQPPVAGGQVTYVQVQQPVPGQQVYQHIVQPQPQGHVVYVQQ